MLSRLRRRLSEEGGISLVETLVAVMILSISMLAMLNTFVASAHATLDQRARAAGTRVATAELERLRSQVWTPGFVNPSGPTTVQSDNRTYTVLSSVSADASAPTPVPNLKHVTTTVSWTVGTTTRSTTLRTQVTSGEASAETVATDAFMTLTLSPNPVRVYENVCLGGYWCPGAPITVTANVVNTTYNGQLQLAWTAADGAPRTLVMSKTGSSWTGSIPGVSLPITFVDPLDREAMLSFTLTALSMPSLSPVSYMLAVLGYDDVAISLNVINNGTSDPVKKSQIRVDWQNDVHHCGGSACKNLDSLYVWAGNIDPNAQTVTLNWTQPASQSLALVPYTTPSGQKVWYQNVATNGSSSRRWYPGGPGVLLNQLPVQVTVRNAANVIIWQSTQTIPVWTAR